MTRTHVRFDPHVHTGASFDAVGSVDAVLERAAERGLDAVAITDHDTAAAARDARDRQDEFGATVVPGAEVSTADGHLLALGVVESPPAGRPLGETVSRVPAAGGLAIVPHPFQRSRHGVRKRDLTDCDGVETFNAWAMTGLQNRRARQFARRAGYPRLGGSDAHDPSMVGRGFTRVAVPERLARDGVSPSALLAAIAAGHTTAVGRTTSPRRYLGKYTSSVGRKVLGRVPLPRS